MGCHPDTGLGCRRVLLCCSIAAVDGSRSRIVAGSSRTNRLAAMPPFLALCLWWGGGGWVPHTVLARILTIKHPGKEPTPRVPREVDHCAGAFSHPFRGREESCKHIPAMWGQPGPHRSTIHHTTHTPTKRETRCGIEASRIKHYQGTKTRHERRLATWHAECRMLDAR
eukprot:scaffold9622_cov113-Isochrysis_galbana.AAC.5